MDTQALESYLGQMRDLILQKQENLLEDDSAIVRLIDEYKSAAAGNSSDEAFFEGEKHFYEGNYEKALKYYLEARELPNFQFFCYRASSLISQDRGQEEKALNYAQKAYKIDSLDPSLKKIYASLRHLEAPQEVHANAYNETHLIQGSDSNFNQTPSHDMSLADNVAVATNYHAMHSSEKNEVDHASGPATTMDFHDPAHKGHSEVSYKYAEGKRNESRSKSFTDYTEGNELEKRIHLFQNMQSEKMHAYLLQSERKKLDNPDNLLCILNGWSFEESEKPLLFTEESRKSNGGHYLRWNGKGIVINPGQGFMDNFHYQGFSIKDIDFVIVTRSSREAYADVRAISELNQQLNKFSSDRQIIHYYLHQKVYQSLASSLKPSFKQARNTIHKLEMFLDSPDVERIELNEDIALHYFFNAMPDSVHIPRDTNDELSMNGSNLGIRLELINDNKKLKIAYLSGLAWSPLLLHHLGYCDLVLAAFGNTSSTDYSRMGYNEDSLGYFGTATLYEELTPRLMLLTEFGGREGDIRLEITRKMRSECMTNSSLQKSTLLPADVGMAIDLNSLQVKCLISEALVDPSHINVVARSDSFGRLSYLSTHYCA